MGERTGYTPGTFCWVDLVVEGQAAAKAFYTATPPHWNCYVSVEDAEAAAGRAEELGATVLLAASDVGDSGRLAAFQDPQGAILSVWQPGHHVGARVVNVPGALAWNDLLTPDVEASAAFYRVSWSAPRLALYLMSGAGQRFSTSKTHALTAKSSQPGALRAGWTASRETREPALPQELAPGQRSARIQRLQRLPTRRSSSSGR